MGMESWELNTVTFLNTLFSIHRSKIYLWHINFSKVNALSLTHVLGRFLLSHLLVLEMPRVLVKLIWVRYKGMTYEIISGAWNLQKDKMLMLEAWSKLRPISKCNGKYWSSSIPEKNKETYFSLFFSPPRVQSYWLLPMTYKVGTII